MDSIATQLTAFADRLAAFPAGLTNRVVGAALALPAGAVLGLARWVEPDPRGYGTHTRLGLGECAMLHFTGYPCPMCGMTTTFSLLAHLRPVDALLNQPFGPVLFSGTVAAAVIGTIDLVFAPGLWRRALGVLDRWERGIASLLLAGLLGGWVYKTLLLHPELRPWGP